MITSIHLCCKFSQHLQLLLVGGGAASLYVCRLGDVGFCIKSIGICAYTIHDIFYENQINCSNYNLPTFPPIIVTVGAFSRTCAFVFCDALPAQPSDAGGGSRIPHAAGRQTHGGSSTGSQQIPAQRRDDGRDDGKQPQRCRPRGGGLRPSIDGHPCTPARPERTRGPAWW